MELTPKDVKQQLHSDSNLNKYVVCLTFNTEFHWSSHHSQFKKTRSNCFLEWLQNPYGHLHARCVQPHICAAILPVIPTTKSPLWLRWEGEPSSTTMPHQFFSHYSFILSVIHLQFSFCFHMTVLFRIHNSFLFLLDYGELGINCAVLFCFYF